MRSLIVFLSICIFVLSCTDTKSKSEATATVESTVIKDSTLVTDSSWGLITAATNYEGLKNIAGSANLKDDRICGPECADSIDVTFLYPGTNREIIVYWKEGAWHQKITSLEAYHENAPYHTASGLKRGSTLEELLQQNGKKISFSGFGWDYGGYIQSYNGGTLENSKIHFRLEIADEGTSLLGDQSFDTDMPEVKKALNKIRIWQLLLSFE